MAAGPSSAGQAPLSHTAGSSLGALEGLAHLAPAQTRRLTGPPPEKATQETHRHHSANLELKGNGLQGKSNHKLKVVLIKTKAPGPEGVTQSSEAGGSDELHELAVAHVPQQALQAALAWKTEGA